MVIEREDKAPVVDLTALLPIEVELVAELATLTLSVSQLRAMQVGDTLDVGSLRSALVRANGKPVFEGSPGEMEGHRSVQLQRRV
jgi:flagellar motor switch protein FliM